MRVRASRALVNATQDENCGGVSAWRGVTFCIERRVQTETVLTSSWDMGLSRASSLKPEDSYHNIVEGSSCRALAGNCGKSSGSLVRC
jgi:hypothetical protein